MSHIITLMFGALVMMLLAAITLKDHCDANQKLTFFGVDYRCIREIK